MSLFRIAIVAACWLLFAGAPPASACNFRESAKTATIRDEATHSFVVVGYIENAREKPGDGSTDFVITKTLQSQPGLAGKKVITIPQFIPIPDPKKPPRFLLIGGIKDGDLEPYRGYPETPTLVEYVEGLLKIDADNRVKLMQFAFAYLEHKEEGISRDAFAVFMNSADPDIRKAGQTFAPEKLRKWLPAEGTQPDRLRLYGYLLGVCGKPEDAALLRKLLDRLVKENGPAQLDGILTGYTLLDPKAGWEYACGLLKSEKEFLIRYAAIRAARYFHDTQPEVLSEADILRPLKLALEDPDMADLAIDDLRKWKVWKMTDAVLNCAKLESHNQVPLNKRAILKFALAASWADPKNKAAAEYVAAARKADPQRVELVEGILKDEMKLPPAPR